MAMTFGKGNRSIAFNPTSAFPLDARSYFESYEKARLAAASAQEASSTETQYYFGQDIVVVENGIASFYIIQPDGTLGEVGGKVEINEKVFTYVDGKLSLIGFADAVGGAQLVKTADGSIAWVKPDTTTVEGLSTAVEGLRTDLNTLTENVYTKGETDSKIAAAVAAAPHLKRKKIESLDDINLEADDVEQYIYMLPSGLTEDDNKYYEYIVIDGVIEPVGAWAVDLDDYAKAADVEEALRGKVDTETGKTLISEEELERLASIPSDAEKNYISSVDETQFNVDDAGALTLLNLEINKITGLEDILNSKVAAEDGKGLSANDFTDELKTKLVTLNLNDISNLQTSVGSLERELYGYQDEEGKDIDGLADFVAALRGDVTTLSGRIDTLDGNITTVSNNLLTLSESVTNINTFLDELDETYVSISKFNAVVGNLDSLLEQQITLVDEINDINERLTWGVIPESND